MFEGLVYVLYTEQGFMQFTLTLALGWTITSAFRGLYRLYRDR